MCFRMNYFHFQLDLGFDCDKFLKYLPFLTPLKTTQWSFLQKDYLFSYKGSFETLTNQ